MTTISYRFSANLKLTTPLETAYSARTAQRLKSPEISEKPQSGTEAAIIYYIKSGGSFSDNTASATHGGARVKSDRTTDYLKLSAAKAIMKAAIVAQEIGVPFTRFVTIHWERAGLTDECSAFATGQLIKFMMDWARRKGEQVHWAWVRENGQTKGSHVHLLVACPLHLHIGRMWRRWLHKITKRPYKAKVIKSCSIGGRLSAPHISPVDYRWHLFNVVAYCCKGVEPKNARVLGLPRTEYGGLIIGTRSAVCQSLLRLIK